MGESEAPDPMSQWRTKSKNYFGEHPEYIRMVTNNNFKTTQKITVDTLLPLTYFVGHDGTCNLYSLNREFKFNDLGSIQLKVRPSYVINNHDDLLVAHDKKVTIFSTNASAAARAQNIDDFMQMALPGQEKPQNLGAPVARFFSCDTKIKDWNHPEYSIIPMDQFSPEQNRHAQHEVSVLVRQIRSQTPFKIVKTTTYDHSEAMKKIDESHSSPPPLSGPSYPGVRQITQSTRATDKFYTICGHNYFEWDIPTCKVNQACYGDGTQLLSIDQSCIMGETIAIGTHSGQAIIIDSRAKETNSVVHSPSQFMPISRVKFSPTIQPLLATSGGDFMVKLWDLRHPEKPYLTLDSHSHEVTSIQFSVHRADFLFTSSYDSTIKVYNINGQYPPHHCLATVTPSPGSAVMEMTAGCHRADSFYYSTADGKTGVAELRKSLFKPVIPHRLQAREDQEAEELSYFRQNQLLLAKILPKVNRILEDKEDVSPIFPLLSLTESRNYDIDSPEFKADATNNTQFGKAKFSLAKSPLAEVIAYYSYYQTSAVPSQFVQSPEMMQTNDARRSQLFASVVGGIQKKDAKILGDLKRRVMAVFDSFKSDNILAIVQILATSSIDDALELGLQYYEHCKVQSKLEKFIDIGYFLLYPTIYDDPTKPFVPYSEKSVDEKTRLKPILSNYTKVKDEMNVLMAIISEAANDKKGSHQLMYRQVIRFDSFISMALLNMSMSLWLTFQNWAHLIVRGAAIAKEMESFYVHDMIMNFLDNQVSPRYAPATYQVLTSEKVDPRAYINAIADVVVIVSEAEQLPPRFEESLAKLHGIVVKSIQLFITQKESIRRFGITPGEFAKRIQTRMEELMSTGVNKNSNRKLNSQSLISVITNAASIQYSAETKPK